MLMLVDTYACPYFIIGVIIQKLTRTFSLFLPFFANGALMLLIDGRECIRLLESFVPPVLQSPLTCYNVTR